MESGRRSVGEISLRNPLQKAAEKWLQTTPRNAPEALAAGVLRRPKKRD
jgi:hypothetical protein